MRTSYSKMSDRLLTDNQLIIYFPLLSHLSHVCMRNLACFQCYLINLFNVSRGINDKIVNPIKPKLWVTNSTMALQIMAHIFTRFTCKSNICKVLTMSIGAHHVNFVRVLTNAGVTCREWCAIWICNEKLEASFDGSMTMAHYKFMMGRKNRDHALKFIGYCLGSKSWSRAEVHSGWRFVNYN
jgi:hypothetical protein